MSAFSDFPVPADFPTFMGHEKIVEYFESFAKHYDLIKEIKFKHKVTDLSLNDDFDLTGKWKVR